jgi:hypothetical protein
MESVVISPVFDDVTEYCVKWAENAVELFSDPPTVIKGRPVTRSEAEEAMEGKAILCFYDHGSEGVLWGDRRVQIVDEDNLHKTPECIYTLSCLSAAKLGVEAWRRGKTFWGYTKPFSFTTNALDKFMLFANNGLKMVLKEGLCWGDALIKTRELGETLVDELLDEGNIIAASCMHGNMNCLVCYNGEAPAESDCPFRSAALRILGSPAWYITRVRAATTTMFLLSALFGLMGEFKHTGAIVLMVACYLAEYVDLYRILKKIGRFRKRL